MVTFVRRKSHCSPGSQGSAPWVSLQIPNSEKQKPARRRLSAPPGGLWSLWGDGWFGALVWQRETRDFVFEEPAVADFDEDPEADVGDDAGIGRFTVFGDGANTVLAEDADVADLD